MKIIGLIGGMSWESTTEYYKIINTTIKEQLGGLHSAKILLYSVDFEEIERYQANNEWDKSAKVLSDIAVNLENAGANLITICTNTMHKVVPEIAKNIKIPIIHIAEATADELIKNEISKVALLGTKYTMTEDFYKQKLIDKNIELVIPNEADIDIVNNIIYSELCLGIVNQQSKQEYLRILADLKSQGAEGVILGCTEIGMLINQSDTDIPVFDTTIIHATTTALKAL